MKTETKINEKLDNLQSEIGENNRMFQELNEQNAKVQSLLELLHADFVQFAEHADHFASSEKQMTMDKFEHQLEHLSKGIQLLVTSLRHVASDIVGIKNNLSHVDDAIR